MNTCYIIRTQKIDISPTIGANDVSALATFKHLSSLLMLAVKTKLIPNGI